MANVYTSHPRIGELRKAIQKLQVESYRYPATLRDKFFKERLDVLRAELHTYKRSSLGLRKKDNPC